MSFALLVKKEVLNKELSKEQAYAFICGVASTSQIYSEVDVIIKINNQEILNFIKKLLHQTLIEFSIHNDNKN